MSKRIGQVGGNVHGPTISQEVGVGVFVDCLVFMCSDDDPKDSWSPRPVGGGAKHDARSNDAAALTKGRNMYLIDHI